MSLYDYRYAWRWLLPLDDVGRIEFQGVPVEAWPLFDLDLLSGRTGVPSSETSMLVCDLNACEFDEIDTSKYDFLVAYGPGRDVASFCSSLGRDWAYEKQYALLPSSNPRLAIPLGAIEMIKRGLKLHRPGRRSARVAVSLLILLLRLGISRPLQRTRLVLVANKPLSFPVGLRDLVSTRQHWAKKMEFAVYFGAVGPNRKTVGLPVCSKPTGIIKTAWSQSAKSSLVNEAQALKRMSMTPLCENVPSLLSFVETERQVTLRQEYREKRHGSRREVGAAIKQFLNALAMVDVGSCSLDQWLSESVTIRHEQAFGRLVEKLKRIADGSVAIDVHRAHGDFAPWNINWSPEGVLVFDWEDSRAGVPALFDAFYFSVASQLFVAKKFVPEKALSKMRRFALWVSGRPSSQVNLYLALWLVDRSRVDDSEKIVSLIECFEDEWA